MNASSVCGKTAAETLLSATRKSDSMRSTETTLGPFKVDRCGLLSPARADQMPGFAVRWRNRLIQAHISGDAEALGVLHMTTRAGRVPSTAALAPSTTGRDAALDLVRDLPNAFPANWRVRLTPDHSILMEARLAVALPVSAVGLVVQMSSYLLHLAPYLDVLDEGGMGLATAHN